MNALTALSANAARAMHSVNPHSHVTYDVPSDGLLEEGGCGKQYGRDYDYKALAEVLDFLVVMDYDSNDYPRNGAPQNKSICPTCFFANAALDVVKAGVECYAHQGVPPSKLVLAFPWYGYDYSCAPGDVANEPFVGHCNVTHAAQISLPLATELMAKSSTGRQWDVDSSTPYFYYLASSENAKEPVLHRVDIDDSQSLRLKYAYAKKAQARGVGMWTASSIDYNDTQYVVFWEDLQVFSSK